MQNFACWAHAGQNSFKTQDVFEVFEKVSSSSFTLALVSVLHYWQYTICHLKMLMFLCFSQPRSSSRIYWDLFLSSRSVSTAMLMTYSCQYSHLFLTSCLGEIRNRISNSFLKLINSKTELLVYGSQISASKRCPSVHWWMIYFTISRGLQPGCHILDSTQLFSSHIKSICNSAFYQLKNISRLQPKRSDSAAETFAPACLVSLSNPAYKTCFSYKILLLTYKSLHACAPQYLSDLLLPYSPF